VAQTSRRSFPAYHCRRLLKIIPGPELFQRGLPSGRQAFNFLALLSIKGSINLEANKGAIRTVFRHILASEERIRLGFSQTWKALETLVTREKRLLNRNLTL